MTDNTGRAHVRAEDRHFVETVALPSALLAPLDAPELAHVAREEIEGVAGGFQAVALLTATECKGLVKLVEARGLGSITWEYDPVCSSAEMQLIRVQAYRSCTRLVLKMPQLAAELWRRLRPLLHVEDIAEVRL